MLVSQGQAWRQKTARGTSWLFCADAPQSSIRAPNVDLTCGMAPGYGTLTQANRLWCAYFCCRNDPNYDSDEERTVLIAPNSSHTRLQEEVTAYKQEVSR